MAVGNLRFSWWGDYLVATITPERGPSISAQVTELHLSMLEQLFRERTLTPDPLPALPEERSRWEMLEFAEHANA